jgi:hypothetical protein
MEMNIQLGKIRTRQDVHCQSKRRRHYSACCKRETTAMQSKSTDVKHGRRCGEEGFGVESERDWASGWRCLKVVEEQSKGFDPISLSSVGRCLIH